MIDEVAVAYHEAGHALLAERFGAHVLSVTIQPANDDGPRRHGETTIAWIPGGKTSEQLSMQQARVTLAGPVAEMIYCDEQYEVRVIREWWADWLVAAGAIRQIRGQLSDDAVLAVIGQLVEELIEWFSQDEVWDRLARLADELEAHDTLERDQLDELRQLGFL